MTATVGERLRAAREGRHLSRPAVEKIAGKGLSVSVQANIENGYTLVNGQRVEYHTTAATIARFALIVGEDPTEMVLLAGLDPAAIPLDVVRSGRAAEQSGFVIVLVRADMSDDELHEQVQQAIDVLRDTPDRGTTGGK